MKNILICGAGGMGNVHARHYSNLPVKVGLFDVDPSQATRLASSLGFEVYPTLEAGLRWADAADVCTPSHLHEQVAMQALDAGKAVFIEKPIAPTLASAERIVEAAHARNLPLMVGQVVRFFPAYRRANALVKEGKFGSIAAVRLRRGGGLPRSPWFLNHANSGGVLVDLGIHELDWLRWTLGPIDHLYARSVGASSGQGPDYGLATLTFKCGAVAHVESTWMDPSGFRVQLEICGSEGMMQYDSSYSGSLQVRIDPSVRVDSPMAATDDPFYLQLSAFVKALEEGEPMPVPGEEGLESLRLALAAKESAETGQVIHF